MSIIIEKATTKDAEILLKYLKLIGAESDNLSFGSEGLTISATAEAEYLSSLEQSGDDIMLLAKENGEIVGSASLNRLPRRMNHRGDFSVSVLKAYWNRGIGSALMSHILAFAKENQFSVIELQVRSDNEAAIHLYKKFGFVKIGTHPSFFKIQNKDVSFDYMILNV